ncbi:hypothetical protein E3P78_00121 [Wallemia ichthyophaga]|nr:hypothetical protein E3P78_00121 [Wallemia ichthyophaga]
MQQPGLKLSFSPSKTFKPIHTQGSVDVSSDGCYLATTLNTQAIVYNLSTSNLIAKSNSDGNHISTLCWAGQLLITTTTNAITIHSLHNNSLSPTRIINKPHDSPILVSSVESSSNAFLATGSADGVVKVWDIHRGYTTHIFKGHAGPVSALCWRRQGSSFQLITGSTDTHIRIWDLNHPNHNKPKHILQGHVSIVRGLSLLDNNTLLSGARDRVVLKWDISSTPKLMRTFPTLNAIEAVGVFPSKDAFFTAGEAGLKSYNVVSGEQQHDYGGGVVKSTRVDSNDDDDDGTGGLATAHLVNIQSTPHIMSVGHDQLISFHPLSSTPAPPRHIIGYPDQIIAAVYVSPTDIAIATNAPQIFILNKHTLPYTQQILTGHTDTVLSLKALPQRGLLVSGSKDGSVRVWKRYAAQFHCVAIASGHGESVGAVAISPCARYLISATQDRIIKLWDLSVLGGVVDEVKEDEGDSAAPTSTTNPHLLSSYTTQRIHEKDINALDISPDSRYLATGSQDRTAKLFEVTFDPRGQRASVNLRATLKAHKRGVWGVRFSPYDRLFATAGGDRAVKVWSLRDFSCIKTLEGHTNSVLDLAFLSNGQQMLTAAADGLLKLWNLHTEQCVATLDGHEDKVWALDISPDSTECVSGGGDSLLTFWDDATETVEESHAAEREEGVIQTETLANLVAVKDYQKAISLAISMDQPRRLYQLFETVWREVGARGETKNSSTLGSSVDGAVGALDAHDLRRLLLHVRTWNAHNRSSAVAQVVLHVVLRTHSGADIRTAFEVARKEDEQKGRDPGYDAAGEFVPHTVPTTLGGEKKAAEEHASLKEIIEGLLPYTQRHLSRADKLVTESYVVDFILQEMDDGLGDVADVDVGEMDVD